MISRAEILSFAARFGVPEEQIVRDHLLSHILHALPSVASVDRVFFGGTALCRTHLLDWRLSEDLDLLVDDARAEERRLSEGLARLLRREHPGVEISWRRDGSTRVGSFRAGGLVVRMQLVPWDASYRRYPTDSTEVALRYPDLPAAVRLSAPTLVGATAMKLNAWAERHTPRDLADLFGLTQRHGITPAAIDLARDVAHALGPWSFETSRRPEAESWRTALAAQMRELPDVDRAFDTVRAAVSEAAGWGD